MAFISYIEFGYLRKLCSSINIWFFWSEQVENWLNHFWNNHTQNGSEERNADAFYLIIRLKEYFPVWCFLTFFHPDSVLSLGKFAWIKFLANGFVYLKYRLTTELIPQLGKRSNEVEHSFQKAFLQKRRTENGTFFFS